jgi:D-sedoheptulose 7-phosphate isomerase
MDQKHITPHPAHDANGEIDEEHGSAAAAALVRSHFAANAANSMRCAQQLAAQIAQCAEIIIGSFLGNHKLLVYGDGPSRFDAEYLVNRLIGEQEQARPPLPAVLLMPADRHAARDSNDYTVTRQIQALGNPGDTMMIVSPDGNGATIAAAIRALREREMRLILLASGAGGNARAVCIDDDALVLVDEQRIIRVLEQHRIAIHAMCDVIDSLLLGDS